MNSYFQLQYKEAEELYAQNRYEEALAAFERIRGYKDKADVSNYVGCCYMYTNRFKEAENCFKNLQERFPKWEIPFYNLGRLYIKTKELSKAEYYIKKALKINPNSSDANFYMGLCYEKSNRLEDAVKFYQESVTIEDSIECHLNLSVCYKTMECFDTALIEARKAYAIDAFDIDAVYNLTYILIVKKQYQEVYNILNNDYWNKSNDVGILKNFLFSSIKVSDFGMAKIIAKRIVVLEPENRLANDFLTNTNQAKDG